MKNKKYHTVRTVPKSNRKIAERCKIDTPNTQMHDLTLFLLGTGTSVTNGGVILDLLTQAPPLGEIMQLCKWSPHLSKILTIIFPLQDCSEFGNFVITLI